MRDERTHVVLADKLAEDIDRLFGTRPKSSFSAEATEDKLLRLRQIQALKAAAGAWKDKDHPELERGSAKWVHKLCHEGERRVQK